jgi:hypothetical protein
MADGQSTLALFGGAVVSLIVGVLALAAGVSIYIAGAFFILFIILTLAGIGSLFVK